MRGSYNMFTVYLTAQLILPWAIVDWSFVDSSDMRESYSMFAVYLKSQLILPWVTGKVVVFFIFFERQVGVSRIGFLAPTVCMNSPKWLWMNFVSVAWNLELLSYYPSFRIVVIFSWIVTVPTIIQYLYCGGLWLTICLNCFLHVLSVGHNL
jgi:hypothetical protein